MSGNVTLLSPIQLGPNNLPNRMAMAPLTRCRAGADNVPTALNVEYYAQRASAGLIISEATPISRQGQGYPNTPGIYSDAQIAGWKKITDAVHAQGSHMFLQLWHVGRISHSVYQPGGTAPVSSSAIKPPGDAMTPQGMQPYETPHALEPDEIPGIIENYRRAAQNAMDAGFDGVEVHGANGYLLDQFLRDGVNQRSDAYGGAIENRARLLLEVVKTVCTVWNSDRVGVRLSPLQPANGMSDSNPEATFSYVVEQLNRFNLAYLHVAEMGKDQPGAAGPAFELRKLRKIWKGIYMVNCGYTRDSGNAALAAGDADMVAFGVPFIANPDLVARFEKNAPLNEPDRTTFYGGDARGYTDYPLLGAS
ncbi:MAG: alkene reductase [Sideroxydans sp.]|nr:alkene reductase [Sideroxydans sp.]